MRADKTKKGFLLYRNYSSGIDALSDADAGRLIKAVFKYVSSGEAVDLPPTANPLFMIIKERLDEDRREYEEICEKRKQAAEEAQRKREEEAIKKAMEKINAENQN